MAESFRSSQGRIVAVRKTPEGYLDVYATFLSAGKLQYSNVDLGVWEEELLWENITDADSLVTASGKPVTLMHPDTPNAMMDASQWRKYGRGMTGQKIFLDHPFATIVCSIGDKELADKIEEGDVTTVSSGRWSNTFVGDDGQKYQGKWKSNHLAFIDSTKGHRGRSPHALVHYGQPPAHLTSQNARGRTKEATYIIRCDSAKLLDYDFDLDKFETDADQIIYLPKIDSTITTENIILPVNALAETMTTTPQKPSAATPPAATPPAATPPAATDTGKADSRLMTAIQEGFANMTSQLTAAITAAIPKSEAITAITDSQATAPMVSEDEVKVLTAEALAAGERRGSVMAIAQNYLPKADQAGLAALTTAEICTKTMGAINADLVVDGSQSEAVLCAMVTTAQSMAKITTPTAPAFSGKEIPATEGKTEGKTDSTTGAVDPAVEIMRKAYEAQEAALVAHRA